jgi:hypothetical protein
MIAEGWISMEEFQKQGDERNKRGDEPNKKPRPSLGKVSRKTMTGRK